MCVGEFSSACGTGTFILRHTIEHSALLWDVLPLFSFAQLAENGPSPAHARPYLQQPLAVPPKCGYRWQRLKQARDLVSLEMVGLAGCVRDNYGCLLALIGPGNVESPVVLTALLT